MNVLNGIYEIVFIVIEFFDPFTDLILLLIEQLDFIMNPLQIHKQFNITNLSFILLPQIVIFHINPFFPDLLIF